MGGGGFDTRGLMEAGKEMGTLGEQMYQRRIQQQELGLRTRAFEQSQADRELAHAQMQLQLTANMADEDPLKQQALAGYEIAMNRAFPGGHFAWPNKVVGGKPAMAGAEAMTPSESMGARGNVSGAQPQAAVPGQTLKYDPNDPTINALQTEMQRILAVNHQNGHEAAHAEVAALLKLHPQWAPHLQEWEKSLDKMPTQLELQEASSARTLGRQEEMGRRRDWEAERSNLWRGVTDARDVESENAAEEAYLRHIATGKEKGYVTTGGDPSQFGAYRHIAAHRQSADLAAANRADLANRLGEARLTRLEELIAKGTGGGGAGSVSIISADPNMGAKNDGWVVALIQHKDGHTSMEYRHYDGNNKQDKVLQEPEARSLAAQPNAPPGLREVVTGTRMTRQQQADAVRPVESLVQERKDVAATLQNAQITGTVTAVTAARTRLDELDRLIKQRQDAYNQKMAGQGGPAGKPGAAPTPPPPDQVKGIPNGKVLIFGGHAWKRGPNGEAVDLGPAKK